MSEPETPAITATTKSPPGTGSVTGTRLLAAQLFNETRRLLLHDQGDQRAGRAGQER